MMGIDRIAEMTSTDMLACLGVVCVFGLMVTLVKVTINVQ